MKLRMVGRLCCLTLLLLLVTSLPQILAQTTRGIDVTVLFATTGTPATGAIIYRGTTAGGPYTQIAAPTRPTGTASVTYFDSAGTAGTRYYYVAEATNAGGPSPRSIEVSEVFPTNPPDRPGVTLTVR